LVELSVFVAVVIGISRPAHIDVVNSGLAQLEEVVSCLEESRSMLYAGRRHQKDVTLDTATACCYLSNSAGMLVLSGLVTLNSSAFLTISRQAGFQRASAMHTLSNSNTCTRALLVYRVVRKG
jgi:hypothetical protein